MNAPQGGATLTDTCEKGLDSKWRPSNCFPYMTSEINHIHIYIYIYVYIIYIYIYIYIYISTPPRSAPEQRAAGLRAQNLQTKVC